MTMFVNARAYDGDPKYTLQYGGSGLNSVVSLDANLIQADPKYPFYCHFNQAANAGLIAGVTLIGQTSGAVIQVGHVVLTQGTVSSAGMGILFYQPAITSVPVVKGENLCVSSTTYCVSASAEANAPLTPIRSMFMAVETNSIRYAIAGVSPSNSGATPASFGMIMPAGSNIVLSSAQSLALFSMLNAISGTLATVDMILNY